MRSRRTDRLRNHFAKRPSMGAANRPFFNGLLAAPPSRRQASPATLNDPSRP